MAELQLDLTESLPEGCMILEGIVVVKCLSEDGNVFLWTGATGGLKSWEGVGMLVGAADKERHHLLDGWTD